MTQLHSFPTCKLLPCFLRCSQHRLATVTQPFTGNWFPPPLLGSTQPPHSFLPRVPTLLTPPHTIVTLFTLKVHCVTCHAVTLRTVTLFSFHIPQTAGVMYYRNQWTCEVLCCENSLVITRGLKVPLSPLLPPAAPWCPLMLTLSAQLLVATVCDQCS